MTASEKYVAAAYLVVFGVVLLYVVIMAAKLSRLERELAELSELASRKPPDRVPEERQRVEVG
jgi:CcmD family protein